MVIMGIILTLVAGLPMGFVVFLTSPWNIVPSDAEVVGVWQVGNTDERLTFYPSHRVTFSNIPKGVVDDAGTNKDATTLPTTATGSWDGFANGEGYGPASGYSLGHGAAEVDSFFYSKWFGSAREIVMTYGDEEQLELDFHRISATP